MKIHMTLDREIPTVQAAEHLRRHPSCGTLNIFSGVSENESIAGLHQFPELPDGFEIGIFLHLSIGRLP